MATVRTTCRICLVRCGMNVEVQDGKVTRITGDKKHPLSKGYLCIKGLSSSDIMMSPRRIIYPQKRVGERGSNQWQRVSWDEALTDIAARLNAIISEHGARAVAVQSLPPKEYYAYDLFCDVIGSPTFFRHDSHSCFNPQLIADTLTFGNLLTYPGFADLQGSDVLMLWGVNLPETNGSKHMRVKEAVKRGARTIVVDPRPTLQARQSDLWLRIRPGTDAALAYGMINVMIANGWYDEKFVRDWTVGFEQLAERASRYTPERVSEITWIPANDIRRAAEMFGTASAAAMHTFIGASMGGNVIATLRLMGFLPALTGRIDQPGSNCFNLPPSLGLRMPANIGAAMAKDLSEQISADRFPLMAGPKSIVTGYPHPRHVIDAILTGKPYPVRALWTDCNPLIGLEDTPLVLEALKKLDLLVVSELFESPTAHLADYILPMTMHLESNAIADYSGLNFVAARTRAVAPRGEAREEAEPLLDVLRRMGYGDRLPVNSYEEMLDFRLRPLEMDFQTFAQTGIYERPHEPLQYRSGKLRRDGKPGFNTPSGKVEFNSSILAEYGYDPLPDFREPPYSPYRTPGVAVKYPFVASTGTRSIEYYSTLGIEVPRLRKRRPWPVVEMAPEAADNLGLAENDWVFVESPTTDRRILRRVALLENMDARVINVEGLWYMPGMDPVKGTLAASANVLTELRDDSDPIIGGSSCRAILCRIQKAEGVPLPA
jgi:thiosulfate reductase/polysulfide reductase chain A